MSIKLIGLDLDGTLLNSDKIISHKTLSTLKKAADSGIHIVPVTGRPLFGIPKQLAALQYIRYLITSNGAITYDRHEQKILRCRCLTYSQAQSILDASRPEIWAVRDVLSNGCGHCEADVIEFMVEISDREYVDMSKIIIENAFYYPSQAESKGELIENISIIAKNPADCSEILESVSRIKNVRIVSQGNCGFEVGSIEADKGMALVELGEKSGIDYSEIMAVGDGGNDIGMLSAVGVSVAMGNASDVLKNAADFITTNCDNDGVAAAIEKYCF